MGDKVKIEPKIITIHEGRPAFYRADEATYRTNKFGQPDKGTAEKPKKPQYRMTWLIDPSSTQGQATIKEIKDEAVRQLNLFFGERDKWPKDNAVTGTKGIITCFGNGNDLPKVYDGFKDMFYVKVADTTRPIVGDRQGRGVQFVKGDGQWHFVDKDGNVTEEVADPAKIPYSGAYCRGRVSLYVYNNEQAGVNANFRSVQFLRPGPAFGGGGARRSAAEELEQMAGDAPGPAAGTAEKDPWD
jgi:hypothetical protein